MDIKVTDKKVKRGGFVEAIRIHEKLATVCKTVDGYAVYDQGVTDHTIAAELNMNYRTVAHVRNSIFGQLRKPPITTLEDRVTQIEEYLTRINKSWRD